MVSLPISEENQLNHTIGNFPKVFTMGWCHGRPVTFFFISRSQLLFRCYQQVLNSLTRFYSQLLKLVLGYHTPTSLFWTLTWRRQVTSCLYPPRGWYRAAAAGTDTESPRLFPYMGPFQRKKGKIMINQYQSWDFGVLLFSDKTIFPQNGWFSKISQNWLSPMGETTNGLGYPCFNRKPQYVPVDEGKNHVKLGLFDDSLQWWLRNALSLKQIWTVANQCLPTLLQAEGLGKHAGLLQQSDSEGFWHVDVPIT